MPTSPKVQEIAQKLSNTDVGGSKNCGREAPTLTKLDALLARVGASHFTSVSFASHACHVITKLVSLWLFLHKNKRSFVGGFPISCAENSY